MKADDAEIFDFLIRHCSLEMVLAFAAARDDAREEGRRDTFVEGLRDTYESDARTIFVARAA